MMSHDLKEKVIPLPLPSVFWIPVKYDVTNFYPLPLPAACSVAYRDEFQTQHEFFCVFGKICKSALCIKITVYKNYHNFLLSSYVQKRMRK